MSNLDDLLSGLRREEEISRFSVRTQAFGMITSPANVGSIMLYGIDPQLEKDVYPVPERIDQDIARLKLKTMGIRIDRLSPQQRKYLSSWSEGT